MPCLKDNWMWIVHMIVEYLKYLPYWKSPSSQLKTWIYKDSCLEPVNSAISLSESVKSWDIRTCSAGEQHRVRTTSNFTLLSPGTGTIMGISATCGQQPSMQAFLRKGDLPKLGSTQTVRPKPISFANLDFSSEVFNASFRVWWFHRSHFSWGDIWYPWYFEDNQGQTLSCGSIPFGKKLKSVLKLG